ncbi:MAG: polyprenol monophosphomannose synthase [Planctomycetaceae bacterium]
MTAPSPTPRVIITLCTYNERENIVRLIPEIHENVPHADVLVIDDNSPDGTGRLVDEMAKADVRIHVLHRAGKQGLGTATLAGFRYGIEHGYDFLINMDADFSHHPRYLPNLLVAMGRADVAIGSRYVSGGGVEGWGWKRHFMSQGINGYARLFLGLKTKDNSGSYRCYRVSKLRELDLGKVRARGYAFQEEILYRCRRVGCRFEETPIVFEDRRYGESKINWKESVSALWVIFRLGVDNLFGVRVMRDESKQNSREQTSF